jgi:hypothetical protein
VALVGSHPIAAKSSEALMPGTPVAFASQDRFSIRKPRRFVTLFGVVLVSCGCATDGFQESLSHSSPETKHDSSSKDADGADKPKFESNDEWANQVGRTARGGPPPKDNTDLLRNFMVSPRAQEIENSLGVN